MAICLSPPPDFPVISQQSKFFLRNYFFCVWYLARFVYSTTAKCKVYITYT